MKSERLAGKNNFVAFLKFHLIFPFRRLPYLEENAKERRLMRSIIECVNTPETKRGKLASGSVISPL
jgi:hypothetical protein